MCALPSGLWACLQGGGAKAGPTERCHVPTRRETVSAGRGPEQTTRGMEPCASSHQPDRRLNTSGVVRPMYM